ncbi:GntR family transcriptional regulator [Catellatospora chokoriensis]|uniref:GntR family transcriptional regulator n=1 Tax=Catellatospora chokoriensis TaxID=310353 RepID=A0A8J3KBP8_9ACTN|nr:GntR family transcriptional regulator [Catellatospora chokoriensis]GIF93798.1 GntR family transcriptional regulator [Catellatospora chokoriensis]
MAETPDRAQHRYEEIANDLRAAIMRGEYREGDRLPGENTIMQRYAVARMTARDALAVLRHEGIAMARQGAGVFVTSRKRLVRDSMGRYSRKAVSTSQFKADTTNAGQQANWDHESAEKPATSRVAQMLGVALGEPVMETVYRFFSDHRPVQLSWSWEPLALTRGTPIELPEDGPTTGVIARMDSIGIHVDRVIEKVTARAATAAESERLALSGRGAYVMVIERTHYAGDLAVEACDIVFPGDRYELTYTIPVPALAE